MTAIYPAANAQEKEKSKGEDKDNLIEVMVHPKKFYKRFFPNLRIKPNPPDTGYIKTYPNYLSAGSHVASPYIQLKLSPTDSRNASRFRTNVPYIVGFNTSYRFVAAGFAFLTRIHAHEDYAKSEYRTATIKLSVKAFSLQYKFTRIKGLTDTNPLNNTGTEHFLKRPDIVNREFQFDAVYNPDWRKYSYPATFSFSLRQVKSRAGFLLNVGLYYTHMTGDSGLIMPVQQPYFKDFDDVRQIRSLSVRVAPGAGGTLVFLRKFYASLVLLPACDLFFYRYLDHPDDKGKLYQTFAFALDSRLGVGYQSKRLYAGIRYDLERKQARLRGGLTITNQYSFLGLELGYRFNAPRFVRKMYKETMPPGM